MDLLQQRTRERLAKLNAEGLRRRLQPPGGIDLCSNDYLGLAGHPLIRERMAEAVLREGCGSTGSRLLRGHREAFDQIERQFAAFKGTERALYFSSGYLANVGALTAFLEDGDVVFSDERNHASLIDGLRLARARRVIFPHCDFKALKNLLEAEQTAGQKFLVTESLFSMDGDRAPLQAYAELCRATQTALIVDEAHAVGIYGPRGSGLIEEMGTENGVFLSINTAGKALGVAGAFVAGPAWAIEHLVQRSRPFIFSTAPPPAVAAALDAALSVIANEPQLRAKGLDNARYLRRRLAEEGLPAPEGDSQIIPIILGGNERAVAVAEALWRQGFDVRAIRPPTVPAGAARLRTSVSAKLDRETLDSFVSALLSALAQVTPCSVASS